MEDGFETGAPPSGKNFEMEGAVPSGDKENVALDDKEIGNTTGTDDSDREAPSSSNEVAQTGKKLSQDFDAVMENGLSDEALEQKTNILLQNINGGENLSVSQLINRLRIAQDQLVQPGDENGQVAVDQQNKEKHEHIQKFIDQINAIIQWQVRDILKRVSPENYQQDLVEQLSTLVIVQDEKQLEDLLLNMQSADSVLTWEVLKADQQILEQRLLTVLAEHGSLKDILHKFVIALEMSKQEAATEENLPDVPTWSDIQHGSGEVFQYIRSQIERKMEGVNLPSLLNLFFANDRGLQQSALSRRSGLENKNEYEKTTLALLDRIFSNSAATQSFFSVLLEKDLSEISDLRSEIISRFTFNGKPEEKEAYIRKTKESLLASMKKASDAGSLMITIELSQINITEDVWNQILLKADQLQSK